MRLVTILLLGLLAIAILMLPITMVWWSKCGDETPAVMYRRSAYQKGVLPMYLMTFSTIVRCHEAYVQVMREDSLNGLDTTEWVYGCHCAKETQP